MNQNTMTVFGVVGVIVLRSVIFLVVNAIRRKWIILKIFIKEDLEHVECDNI
jgi:hypothetical protein